MMRWTVGAFSVLRYSLRETRPAQLGIPAIAIDSLIVQGTPWKGGRSSGSAVDATSASAASASARAASKRSTTTALMRSCMCSMRSMCASTTSRELVSRVRIARARSVAEHSVSGWLGARTAIAPMYKPARHAPCAGGRANARPALGVGAVCPRVRSRSCEATSQARTGRRADAGPQRRRPGRARRSAWPTSSSASRRTSSRARSSRSRPSRASSSSRARSPTAPTAPARSSSTSQLFDLHVKRSRILHADEDTLDYVPPWYGERVLALGEARAARVGADRAVDAGPAERPRSRARGTRPAAVPARVRARRQRAHDELDRGAVPDAPVGGARLPRRGARARARAALGAGRVHLPPRRGRPGGGVARAPGRPERRRRAADRAPLRRAALRGAGNRSARRPAAQLTLDLGALSHGRRHRAHAQPAVGGDLHDARSAARRGHGALDEAARRRRDDHPRAARSLRGRRRGLDRGRRGRRAAGPLRRARRGRVTPGRGRARRRRGPDRPAEHGLLRHAHRRERRVARRARLGLRVHGRRGGRRAHQPLADPHRLHDRLARRSTSPA